MNLKVVKNKLTSKIGRQILLTQKHSPTLLFGAGAAGVVVTVVLACRATLKMSDVLDDGEKNLQAVVTEDINDDSELSDSEKIAKASKNVKLHTALTIAKLYAPAVIVGTLTVGALTGSHVVLSRRNIGLTAAYSALDKGFREYRGRVVEEYGKEKDAEFRYGVGDREIAVETDDGIAVKTVRVLNPTSTFSIYSRVFDEYNTNWRDVPAYNQLFIQSQQNYANDLLRARGHVFLNEVYNMLGFEHSKEGAVVGWVRGEGDDYIDFGVFTDQFEGKEFVVGNSREIHLDFNVDGVIYDKI